MCHARVGMWGATWNQARFSGLSCCVTVWGRNQTYGQTLEQKQMGKAAWR
jgi:hypothetical protein